MIIQPKHPLILLSKELESLCKPLELFHVHHFTYQKQYLDGSRITLSNKPQWIADYYNLHLHNTSLFEEKHQIYQAEFQVWIGDYDLAVYQHGKLYYDSAHCITVTEPQPDGCEFYFFATSANNQRAIHFLSNNMDILYHFILYLKDRGERLLKKASNNKLVIASELPKEPNIDSALPDNFSYQTMQKIRKKFFQQTHVYHYTFNNRKNSKIKLSSREIDCIHYLLLNKTAQETSELMNVSRRTVESYLENIKNKFECDTKQSLLQKLKTQKMLAAIRE